MKSDSPQIRRVRQPSSQLALDEGFEYVVKRQRRKTIALHVLDDATVEVRAPRWVPQVELAAFVEARLEWVIEQRRAALDKRASRPRFVHGQQHYFLGRRYPILLSHAARSSVQWEGAGISIGTPFLNDSRRIEDTLMRWYRQQADEVFEERLFACFESFPDWFQDKYPMPAVKIRKMRRRWGSCSSKGDITLNLQLVKMPLNCIDYVICHELCHLEVFHHGRAFYSLLAQVIPDWKQREVLFDQLADI